MGKRRRVLLAVLALACVATGACKKDKPGSSNKALRYFPADVITVGGVQFNVLADYLKKVAPGLDPDSLSEMLLAQSEELRLVAETCDVDPLTVLESMTFGYGPDLKDKSQSVFAFETSLTAKRTSDCIEKLSGMGRDIAVKADGEFFVYRVEEKSYSAWWPTEHTVVWIQSESPARLKAIADGGKTVLDNPGLAALVAKTKTAGFFWTAGAVPADPDLAPIFDQVGATPTQGYAWLDMDSGGVTGKIALTFPDEAGAKRAHDMASAFAKLLENSHKDIDGLEVTLSGREAIATLDLDTDAITALKSIDLPSIFGL